MFAQLSETYLARPFGGCCSKYPFAYNALRGQSYSSWFAYYKASTGCMLTCNRSHVNSNGGWVVPNKGTTVLWIANQASPDEPIKKPDRHHNLKGFSKISTSDHMNSKIRIFIVCLFLLLFEIWLYLAHNNQNNKNHVHIEMPPWNLSLYRPRVNPLPRFVRPFHNKSGSFGKFNF